jgi:hypothetical protein
MVTRVIVAPSVIQRCGTAAPLRSPPDRTIQRADVACSLRAPSALVPVLRVLVQGQADRVGLQQ